ncbi:MAG: multicopper oxidase domain-containing protein, partial [Deltaproteobacteria bacterium]
MPRASNRRTLLFVTLGGLLPAVCLAQQKPVKKPATMPGMAGMPGMTDTSKTKKATAPKAPMKMSGDSMAMEMGMPIPMPKGMPMIPGLVGLVPPVTSFLPGAGVDVKRLPAVKPSQVARLKSGDTLDLTAMLVRRTIRGRSFAMYGFNGQVPGPLIRVPQNATITVRFHNRID